MTDSPLPAARPTRPAWVPALRQCWPLLLIALVGAAAAAAVLNLTVFAD